MVASTRTPKSVQERLAKSENGGGFLKRPYKSYRNFNNSSRIEATIIILERNGFELVLGRDGIMMREGYSFEGSFRMNECSWSFQEETVIVPYKYVKSG